jgi:hypothetical protein
MWSFLDEGQPGYRTVIQMRRLVYFRPSVYLNRMLGRLSGLDSPWRKWLLRFALVSFVGLYSLGLLPHHHSAAPDDLNCPVCHAVSGLTDLTGHFSPPGIQHIRHVLQLLLVLPWLIVAIACTDKFLLLKRSRAPPLP